MRRTQQALPPENVPERPLLRYTIAKMIFDTGLSDIDHGMADWLYYRDDLFAVADQIIERWIDHPHVGILDHWIDPICAARGCQCTLMKEEMQEVRDAAKKETTAAASASIDRSGSNGGTEPDCTGNGQSRSANTGEHPSLDPSFSGNGGRPTSDGRNDTGDSPGSTTSGGGGTPVRASTPAKPRRSRAHVSKRRDERSAETAYANGDVGPRLDGHDPKAA